MNNYLQSEIQAITSTPILSVNSDQLQNNFKAISNVLNYIIDELYKKQLKIDQLEETKLQDKEFIDQQLQSCITQINEQQNQYQQEYNTLVQDQFNDIFLKFKNELTDTMSQITQQYDSQKQIFEQQKQQSDLLWQQIEIKQINNIRQILDKVEKYVIELDQISQELILIRNEISDLTRDINIIKSKNYMTIQDANQLIDNNLKQVRNKVSLKLQKIDQLFTADNKLQNVILPQINQQLQSFQESLYTQFADKTDTTKRLNQLQESMMSTQQEYYDSSFIKRPLNWSCASCDRSLDFKNLQIIKDNEKQLKPQKKFGMSMLIHSKMSSKQYLQESRQSRGIIDQGNQKHNSPKQSSSVQPIRGIKGRQILYNNN